MSRVLVIGCGGVASVAIQKCCQADEVFTELCIASRTKEKCDALAEKLVHHYSADGEAANETQDEIQNQTQDKIQNQMQTYLMQKKMETIN